jgi:sulfur carrier protein
MIAYTLNGESRQLETPKTITQLLEDLGYAGKRVAVEKNGEIVPKSLHATTLVEPDSRIEIVVAVGGG